MDCKIQMGILNDLAIKIAIYSVKKKGDPNEIQIYDSLCPSQVFEGIQKLRLQRLQS